MTEEHSRATRETFLANTSGDKTVKSECGLFFVRVE
jgi:hypothetical protein